MWDDRAPAFQAYETDIFHPASRGDSEMRLFHSSCHRKLAASVPLTHLKLALPYLCVYTGMQVDPFFCRTDQPQESGKGYKGRGVVDGDLVLLIGGSQQRRSLSPVNVNQLINQANTVLHIKTILQCTHIHTQALIQSKGLKERIHASKNRNWLKTLSHTSSGLVKKILWNPQRWLTSPAPPAGGIWRLCDDPLIR